MPVGQGDYADFAKVLYKLNGYRPGPVKGWYVVVCAQSLARPGPSASSEPIPSSPCNSSSDLVFETEEEARGKKAAERCGTQIPVPCACRANPLWDRSVERKAAEAIEIERQYRSQDWQGLAATIRGRPRRRSDASAAKEAPADFEARGKTPNPKHETARPPNPKHR